MKFILSPAKLLDEKPRAIDLPGTQPLFLDKAEFLVKKLQKVSAHKLGEMMDLSNDLSTLNKKRYHEWHRPFTEKNAKHAILLFKGEVYRGMKADDFTKSDLSFAQEHLRILSGLYGLLKPLDLIQPYRLMMGTPFSPSAKFKNLYQFWGNDLSDFLTGEMGKDEVLVSLASAEYFKAISPQSLQRKIIVCDFRDYRDGKYVSIQTFTKLARGYMARFIIKNRINEPEHLKAFDSEGYHFNSELSSTEKWIFTRDKS